MTADHAALRPAGIPRHAPAAAPRSTQGRPRGAVNSIEFEITELGEIDSTGRMC